jgi:hypothetical protein
MGLCTDNHWQPTFVHEPGHPRGQFPHYVMPDGSFVKLRGDSGTEWVAHACELIAQHGLRAIRVGLRLVRITPVSNVRVSVVPAKATPRAHDFLHISMPVGFDS